MLDWYMLDYSQCPSLNLLKIKAKVFLDVRWNIKVFELVDVLD